jgi:hypothetical protein
VEHLLLQQQLAAFARQLLTVFLACSSMAMIHALGLQS